MAAYYMATRDHDGPEAARYHDSPLSAMKFLLAGPSFVHASALTPTDVWYSNGSTLHRSSLATLEGCAYTFPDTIWFIWTTKTGLVKVYTHPPSGDPRIWTRTDAGWVDATLADQPDIRQSFTHPRYRIATEDRILYLVCDSRAGERAQHLLKDKVLAARVCHYLQC